MIRSARLIFVGAALLALVSCSTSKPSHSGAHDDEDGAVAQHQGHGEQSPEHHEAHGSGEEGAHDHSDHEHGASSTNGGDHMDHMRSVRDLLMENLGEQYEDPLPEPTQADLEAGAATFQQICATCHGPEGRGDGPGAEALAMPPANFTDAAHARFYSDRGRLWIVRNGIPDTPMVGWESTLGEEATYQVYAYVRTLAGEPPSTDGGQLVEISAEGTRFDPPVGVEQIPAGAYYCDMGGSVHYASTEAGDGSCPVCGMFLTQGDPSTEEVGPSAGEDAPVHGGHDHGSHDH